jgi:hypothetical protein
MSISTRRPALVVALVSVVLALFGSLVSAGPARANDDQLRERAHARIAAILSAAVEDGVFSESQENYVTSALLPVWVDPKDLSKRAERKTVKAFWSFVGESSGLDEDEVLSRLSRGQTLTRIAGDGADDLRDGLYNWLARPVAAAVFDGDLTYSESIELRDDIQRAVYRLMIQSGGGDRPVTPSPRRR